MRSKVNVQWETYVLCKKVKKILTCFFIRVITLRFDKIYRSLPSCNCIAFLPWHHIECNLIWQSVPYFPWNSPNLKWELHCLKTTFYTAENYSITYINVFNITVFNNSTKNFKTKEQLNYICIYVYTIKNYNTQLLHT